VSMLDVQPAPAAEPTSAVPIAQQVESLTPAEAKTRLSELTHDKEWGARFMASKPGSVERNLFDALTRKAADMPAAEPAAVPMGEQERSIAEQTTPPEKPGDYRITYVDHPDTPGVPETAENVRAWLHAANFAQKAGQDLIADIAREVPKLRAMSPEARELRSEANERAIERILGPNYEAHLEAGARLLDRIERARPGVRAWLQNEGLINEPRIVVALVQHALALELREKGNQQGRR